ncbi:hypothetical protein [Puia dinghuensis]|uniref:Uncharacterized protein n=1 Tax=Puia dinghuensis TaxID=1792502 RepID=A0A8J2U8B8_9BACT|nr:hypothetical protein [Puia dinghuensis]GGA86131.1 hypothetical protein GCM10011511_06480 [Puia dinghuensis]
MRRLNLSISFLLLFFTPLALQAQNITGIWQGHFRSSNASQLRSSIFDDRYKFEVQVAQHEKTFEAVTYSYLSSFFYGKAAAAGTVNVRTSKVLLQEGKLLEVRNSFGDVCIMTCFLQYTKSGDDEFLEGTYVSMNTRDSSNCGRGTVFLRKVPISDFYTEPFVAKREKEIAKADSLKERSKVALHKPLTKPMAKPGVTAAPLHKPAGTASTTPAKSLAKTTPPETKTPVKKTEQPTRTPPIAKIDIAKEGVRQAGKDSNLTNIGRKFPTIAPRVLVDRQNQLVKTIVVHTNEVTLNIYDDGVIDGDTVSVYLDNKEVINHAMLTDKPLIVTIHLDETNDYHEVVMVAENEGTIPPNTSLMIVKAGDKEYEVRITSTEQKNAVVRFQYEK